MDVFERYNRLWCQLHFRSETFAEAFLTRLVPWAQLHWYANFDGGKR
jgi:hypothetical protein